MVYSAAAFLAYSATMGRELGKEKKAQRIRVVLSHIDITRAVKACVFAADAIHDSSTCYLKSSIKPMDRVRIGSSVNQFR